MQHSNSSTNVDTAESETDLGAGEESASSDVEGNTPIVHGKKALINKTDSASSAGGPRKTDSGLRHSLRKRGNEMGHNIGQVLTNAAGGGGTGGASLSGQIAVALGPAIEAVRTLVASQGFKAWTRTSPVSVAFDEPVVLAGVQVGSLIGNIVLVPANDAACRTNFVKSKLSRPLRAGEEVIALQCHAEAQLENGKVPWRRVWLMLSFSGQLYVLPKPPVHLGGGGVGNGGGASGAGGASGTGGAGAAMPGLEKLALAVADVTEGSFGGSSPDKPNSIQITGRGGAAIWLAFERAGDLNDWMAGFMALVRAEESKKKFAEREAAAALIKKTVGENPVVVEQVPLAEGPVASPAAGAVMSPLSRDSNGMGSKRTSRWQMNVDAMGDAVISPPLTRKEPSLRSKLFAGAVSPGALSPQGGRLGNVTFSDAVIDEEGEEEELGDKTPPPLGKKLNAVGSAASMSGRKSRLPTGMLVEEVIVSSASSVSLVSAAAAEDAKPVVASAKKRGSSLLGFMMRRGSKETVEAAATPRRGSKEVVMAAKEEEDEDEEEEDGGVVQEEEAVAVIEAAVEEAPVAPPPPPPPPVQEAAPKSPSRRYLDGVSKSGGAKKDGIALDEDAGAAATTRPRQASVGTRLRQRATAGALKVKARPDSGSFGGGGTR
jgi:hypothetical protein